VQHKRIFIGTCVIDATVSTLTLTAVRFQHFLIKFSFVFDARLKKPHCGAIIGWATAGYWAQEDFKFVFRFAARRPDDEAGCS
jgi:hypothetical protein